MWTREQRQKHGYDSYSGRDVSVSCWYRYNCRSACSQEQDGLQEVNINIHMRLIPPKSVHNGFLRKHASLFYFFDTFKVGMLLQHRKNCHH